MIKSKVRYENMLQFVRMQSVLKQTTSSNVLTNFDTFVNMILS